MTLDSVSLEEFVAMLFYFMRRTQSHRTLDVGTRSRRVSHALHVMRYQRGTSMLSLIGTYYIQSFGYARSASRRSKYLGYTGIDNTPMLRICYLPK
jgi:hypothetical protein